MGILANVASSVGTEVVTDNRRIIKVLHKTDPLVSLFTQFLLNSITYQYIQIRGNKNPITTEII